jgi:hypothetical protein
VTLCQFRTLNEYWIVFNSGQNWASIVFCVEGVSFVKKSSWVEKWLEVWILSTLHKRIDIQCFYCSDDCFLCSLHNLFLFGSTVLCWALAAFQFLDLTQAAGLLERGISPSQGLYLNTGQHKHRINTYTPNIHILSGIRTHEHSVRASEDSSCLRPLGHCDRLASEQARTVRALDRSATVIDIDKITLAILKISDCKWWLILWLEGLQIVTKYNN